MNVLSDGIDGFTKELKRLPRQVKALPICHILEEKMKEFKESIPLFSDLKNEALRERYAADGVGLACSGVQGHFTSRDKISVKNTCMKGVSQRSKESRWFSIV